MSPTQNLSPGEEKLLQAVIQATKKGATEGKFTIRMVGYDFHLDLDGYSGTITDTAEKQAFEEALKALCGRGLLTRTDTHAHTGQQWEYSLSGAALEHVAS